jgi:hypothetical protein
MYNFWLLYFGIKIGTSFRVMMWMIIHDLYLHLSKCPNIDFRKSKQKYDHRYWIVNRIVYQGDKLIKFVDSVEIPEKYIYAITTNFLTMFKTSNLNVNSISDWIRMNQYKLMIDEKTLYFIDNILYFNGMNNRYCDKDQYFSAYDAICERQLKHSVSYG